MVAIQFNVGNNSYASYRVVIGSTAYDMTFRYNGRLGRWSMDFLDATTQVYLWRGLKIMPTQDNTFFTAPEFRERVGSFLTLSNFDFEHPLPITLDNFARDAVQHSFVFEDVEMRELTNV